MVGRPRKIPSYGRHKASGQAVVCINGRDVYLGKYGTPESYRNRGRCHLVQANASICKGRPEHYTFRDVRPSRAIGLTQVTE